MVTLVTMVTMVTLGTLVTLASLVSGHPDNLVLVIQSILQVFVYHRFGNYFFSPPRSS